MKVRYRIKQYIYVGLCAITGDYRFVGVAAHSHLPRTTQNIVGGGFHAAPSGIGEGQRDRYRVPVGIVNIEIAGINVDQYIIIVITGAGGRGNPPLQKFNNYHPLLRIFPILRNTC